MTALKNIITKINGGNDKKVDFTINSRTLNSRTFIQDISGTREGDRGCGEDEPKIIQAGFLDDQYNIDGKRCIALDLTLIAAGFVIGIRGSSMQQIYKTTNVSIRSDNETKSGRDIRVFKIKGEENQLLQTINIFVEAVDLYRELLQKADEVVPEWHDVQGIKFYYCPPPITAIPESARTRDFNSNLTPSQFGRQGQLQQLQLQNRFCSVFQHYGTISRQNVSATGFYPYPYPCSQRGCYPYPQPYPYPYPYTYPYPYPQFERKSHFDGYEGAGEILQNPQSFQVLSSSSSQNPQNDQLLNENLTSNNTIQEEEDYQEFEQQNFQEKDPNSIFRGWEMPNNNERIYQQWQYPNSNYNQQFFDNQQYQQQQFRPGDVPQTYPTPPHIHVPPPYVPPYVPVSPPNYSCSTFVPAPASIWAPTSLEQYGGYCNQPPPLPFGTPTPGDKDTLAPTPVWYPISQEQYGTNYNQLLPPIRITIPRHQDACTPPPYPCSVFFPTPTPAPIPTPTPNVEVTPTPTTVLPHARAPAPIPTPTPNIEVTPTPVLSRAPTPTPNSPFIPITCDTGYMVATCFPHSIQPSSSSGSGQDLQYQLSNLDSGNSSQLSVVFNYYGYPYQTTVKDQQL